MPALTFPAPVLFVSSDPSFFGILKEHGKDLSLTDVTRIDFPLIEKNVINKEHLVHALKSLEQKEINLIVSDEIFLHHIADYGPEAQKKIAESIKETVASVFSDEKDPLHIVTVDLAKTSKLQTIQISALTKTNLSLIEEAASETGTTIVSVVPASFVVKAFVSVDPSLFVLLTEHSYLLTSHYIGVDFATNISKADEDTLVSTIKKLKKERDHIQHVYICAEEKDLAKLHDKLETIMPVQDVEAPHLTTEGDTPYFLTVLTAGLKDVVENDFPLPVFTVSVDSSSKFKAETKSEEEEEVVVEVEEKAEKTEAKEEVVAKKVVEEEDEESDDDDGIEIDEKKLTAVEKKAAAMPVEEDETEVIETTDEEEKEEKAIEALVMPKPTLAAAATTTVAASTPVIKSAATSSISLPSAQAKTAVEDEVKPAVSAKVEESSKPTPAATVVKRSEKKKGGSVFKYIFLTLGVAILISLIGGGIVISQQALTQKNGGKLQTPVAEATNTPTEAQMSPSPEPTAKPVSLKELSVLVVNATKTPGKAGKVATSIKKEVKTVETGNAKDEYDKGTFIMFAKPELSSTKETFEEKTNLKFEVQDMSNKENPDDKYDIVIVLGE